MEVQAKLKLHFYKEISMYSISYLCLFWLVHLFGKNPAKRGYMLCIFPTADVGPVIWMMEYV